MLVSDIEANGLLDTVTKFHCASTCDYETKEYKRYYPWDFGQYLDDLQAEMDKPDGLLVYHNGIKYDYPAIEKLAKLLLNRDFKFDQKKCLDSLVMARLVFSNVGDLDIPLIRRGKLAGSYFGKQGLEAWGYRLGEMKGEYKGDPAILDIKERAARKWESYNEEMGLYCVQDVKVTVALLDKIFSDKYYYGESVNIESIRLEHDASWVLAEMERNGFPFNESEAEKLYSTLAADRQNLLMELVGTFGSWYAPAAKGKREAFRHPTTGAPLDKYPKVVYPKGGALRTATGALSKTSYFKDRPYTPIDLITFNPASRAHLLKVLQEAGWTPTEFTDNDNPIVDDEQLQNVIVSDPHKMHCIELIRTYLMLQKRISQLATGKAAWLLRHTDGIMHGQINPNGAVTGRATHSSPNMGQVPSVGKPYGAECRDLFGACWYGDGSWLQVGVDASGLELRCLGHFMARYDEGAYIDVILNGDIHTVNQLAAGLPTRNNAKTFK